RCLVGSEMCIRDRACALHAGMATFAEAAVSDRPA
ncbi:hypothetical protein, partial [Pseudomonas aeruginosa]